MNMIEDLNNKGLLYNITVRLLAKPIKYAISFFTIYLVYRLGIITCLMVVCGMSFIALLAAKTHKEVKELIAVTISMIVELVIIHYIIQYILTHYSISPI